MAYACICHLFFVILQRKICEPFMRRILIVLMTFLFSSCMAHSSAELPRVVSLHFHKTNCSAIPEIWFDFKMDEDGSCTLINCSGRSEYEALQAIVPAKVADSLAKIAKEEKMTKYKEHYRPPFQVYDGWQWSLYIRFEDKTSCSSSGHMERPRGEGLKRLVEYLNEVWKQVEDKAETIDITNKIY